MRAVLFTILIAGCGLDPFGEGPGGATDLPTIAAGPYQRFASDDGTPADEPFVVSDGNADLADPAVLEGGAGLRIWMTRAEAGAPIAIAYVEVAGVHAEPTDLPRIVLAADQPWEQGRVAAPSVVDLGGRHLTMFYEGGDADRAIGRADSTDDGATWAKAAAPVLTHATAPSAAFASDRFELYVTRTDAAGIWRATGADGVAFALDAAAIIEPRPGLAKAFDAATVGDPDVVVHRESTGRLHWGLYFVGTDLTPDDAGTMAHPAIGYAASFDGVTWERFGGAAAQLGAPATGPAVLIQPAHGLMLYVETKRGFRAIAAAHSP
jgi:hypothetical protein